MKKKLILLVLVTICFNLYGQDETNINKSIRLGVLYSLDNNLESTPVTEIGNFVKNSNYYGYITNYDKFNYKVGITFEALFSNKLAVNSGLNYSNKNFDGFSFNSLNPLSLRPFISTDLETIEIEFIEIPLSFRYYFLPNKFRVFTDLGVISQFKIGGGTLIDKSTVLSGKLGGGIEYNLDTNFSVQLFTEYNRSLTKLIYRSNYTIKTISFGLRVAKTI